MGTFDVGLENRLVRIPFHPILPVTWGRLEAYAMESFIVWMVDSFRPEPGLGEGRPPASPLGQHTPKLLGICCFPCELGTHADDGNRLSRRTMANVVIGAPHLAVLRYWTKRLKGRLASGEMFLQG